MADPNAHRWITSAVAAAATPRAGLDIGRPSASFISQLIAESEHLPPQRERRRASPAVAAIAYAHGAEQGACRMPAGFRKNLSV